MGRSTKQQFKAFGMFAAAFYLFALASTFSQSHVGVALAATFASLAFALALVLEAQGH